MLAPLICGASCRHPDNDEVDDHDISPSCLIRRRSRKHTSKKINNNTNPYSSLGLDKFSKLLAELEAKKKQIYSQTDPRDVSLVRFVCKGTEPDKDCKPVVIKVRQDHQQNSALELKQQSFGRSKREANNAGAKPSKMLEWSTKAWLVIILILVCLAAFGRSGATVIMAVGWYLVPVASSKNLKKDKQVAREIGVKMAGSKSNKDYVRKLSENWKMERSQKKGHAHRQSW